MGVGGLDINQNNQQHYIAMCLPSDRLHSSRPTNAGSRVDEPTVECRRTSFGLWAQDRKYPVLYNHSKNLLYTTTVPAVEWYRTLLRLSMNRRPSADVRHSRNVEVQKIMSRLSFTVLVTKTDIDHWHKHITAFTTQRPKMVRCF